ncbi:MAG: Rpn family recombination-promoting nuclease/putative transposase [Cyanobacteria bacterium P01_F01_bin.150]
MGFIDPKTDFGFKRIFGSAQSVPVLKSFLNAIIYNGEAIIQDLTILDPYQNPENTALKQSILDVKVKLNDGSMVLVEMQVLPVVAFVQRVMYNLAKAYTAQLGRGEGYSRLEPVIAVTITDFVLFPDHKASISHYQFWSEELKHRATDQLQCFFVELPKFHQSLEQLHTAQDEWLYFLKEAYKFRQAPESLIKKAEFEIAFSMANEGQLSSDELELLAWQRKQLMDEQGRVEYGIQQGIEQGLERGLEQGREQGREQGAQQERLETTKRLLGVLDVEAIAQATGLSTEEVEQLQEA